MEGGFIQGCRWLGPQRHRRGWEVGRPDQHFAWDPKGLQATVQHEKKPNHSPTLPTPGL